MSCCVLSDSPPPSSSQSSSCGAGLSGCINRTTSATYAIIIIGVAQNIPRFACSIGSDALQLND